MKKSRCFWLLALALILLGQGREAFAQSPQTLEIGPHGGISCYLGDINPWKPFSQFDMQVGGVVRYNYDSRWAFRLDYTLERVKAADTVANWRPERNLGFRSKVHDLSAIVEFNFLDYYTGRPGSTISPYIFAGISVFMYQVQPYVFKNPKNPEYYVLPDEVHEEYLGPENDHEVVYYDEFSVLTEEEMIERAREITHIQDDSFLNFLNKTMLLQPHNVSVSIPFGVGCKLSLSKHLAAAMEWRMHYTFTDYLDNIRGVYSNPLDEYMDPTGQYQVGQQRGNSKTKDWFGTLSLSLTWKFNLPGRDSCKLEKL